MAAEVQRMREQLELLQAELLCNNARGRCLEDTDVISFCHIFLMLLVVNLKIGQRLQVCFHGHIFVKGHLFEVSFPRKVWRIPNFTSAVSA